MILTCIFLLARCEEKCESGFYGDGCHAKCQCQNNGNCSHIDGSCTCPHGWTVRSNIDEIIYIKVLHKLPKQSRSKNEIQQTAAIIINDDYEEPS